MATPPNSPPLFGASRTTGGTTRGRAVGNVFNLADPFQTDTDFMPQSRLGKVHIYTSHADPSNNKPDMVLKHEVTPRLEPVLKSLARSYSPVESEWFYITRKYSENISR